MNVLDRAVKSLAIAAVVCVTGPGCGDESDPVAERAEVRRAQAEDLARRAGLPEGVADVIVDAAGSVAATYTVTYRSADGTRVSIFSDPPRRRVDVSAAGRPDRRTIATDEETLACTRQASGGWRCEVGPPSELPGGISPDQVAATVDALRAAADVRAERTRIAGAPARCVVFGETSLCVSDAGVPLRVAGLGRAADLEATSYRPTARDQDFRPPSHA